MGQYDEIYSTSSEEPLTTSQQATSAIAAEVSDFVTSIAAKKRPKRAKISPLYQTAQFVVANGNEIKRVYDVPITLVPHFGTLSHKLHEEVDTASLLEALLLGENVKAFDDVINWLQRAIGFNITLSNVESLSRAADRYKIEDLKRDVRYFLDAQVPSSSLFALAQQLNLKWLDDKLDNWFLAHFVTIVRDGFLNEASKCVLRYIQQLVNSLELSKNQVAMLGDASSLLENPTKGQEKAIKAEPLTPPLSSLPMTGTSVPPPSSAASGQAELAQLQKSMRSLRNYLKGCIPPSQAGCLKGARVIYELAMKESW